MEGVLLKWTNYVSGWQQRYFTLKDGILSYYRSEEEVNSGCKGSVKLSVCDVIVHSSDPRRFDLILGEQRFYLRALSQADRQRWVIALGNCKAGNPVNPDPDEVHPVEYQTRDIASHQSELRLYHNLLVQQVKALKSTLKEDTVPDMKRINEITSTLNAACSTFLSTVDELVSLCHAQVPGQGRATLQPGLDRTGLSSSTDLPPTMGPLISTPQLDRKLALQSRLGTLTRPRSPSLVRSLAGHSITKNEDLYSWFPDDSPRLYGFTDPVVTTSGTPATRRKILRGNRKYKTFFSTMEFSFEDLRPNLLAIVGDESNANVKLPGDYLSALDFARACRALFRIFDRLARPFPGSNSSGNPEDVVVTPLAGTARGSTAIKQVQTNVQNNLDRLELAAHECADQSMCNGTTPGEVPLSSPPTTPTSTATTQTPRTTVVLPKQVSIGHLVRRDVANGSTGDANSVYLAILWLARSLNFVREFLHLLFLLPPPASPSSPRGLSTNGGDTDLRVRLSDDSLSVVATEAYSRCLRSFHQWSLRGVAMIVIKSLPSRSHFLHTLLMDNLTAPNNDTSESSVPMIHADLIAQPELYAQLHEDSRNYSDALGRTLTLIEGLFACLDLERVFTGSETY